MRRTFGLLCFVLLAVWVGGPLGSPARAAATFVVNDVGDAADASPGDGTCATAEAVCTLRAAIQEANALAGTDTINFLIGSGVQTISPALALPIITGPVVIDGTTQPGFSAFPIIELDGSGAPTNSAGLRVVGSSTIRGLVLNDFGAAIEVYGSGNTIRGNFLGTAADGITLDANKTGLNLYGSNNVIGGLGPPPLANVIVSDQQDIYSPSGSSNLIEGNIIGSNINAVVGEGWDKVRFTGSSTQNTVRGNLIMSKDTQHAVELQSGSHEVEGNTIRGHVLVRSTGNRISENSIHATIGAFGIWLFPSIDDQDFGDPFDGDAGPNDLQNYPALTAASSAGPSTTVDWSLHSAPLSQFTIEFFSNPSPQFCGIEAQTFLGSISRMTDSSGNANGSDILPVGTPHGHFITATATNSSGSTSPLSNCEPVGDVATLAVELHDASHSDMTGATVTVGTVLHANLGVTGVGPPVSGTADWYRFPTADCSGLSVEEVFDIPLSGGVLETYDYATVGAEEVSYFFHYDGDSTYAPADSGCVAALVIDSAEVFDPYPPFAGCVSSPAPPAETMTITCNNPSNSMVSDDRLAVSASILPTGMRTMAAGDTVHFTATMTPGAFGYYGLILATDAARYVSCGYAINRVDLNGDTIGDFTYQLPLIGYGTIGSGVATQIFGPTGAGAFATWNVRLTIEYTGISGLYNVSCNVLGPTTYRMTAQVPMGSNVLEAGAVFSNNQAVVNPSGVFVGAPTGPGSVVYTNPEITPGLAPPPILIDPSGFVYESPNTSLRIPGAAVELQRWNGSSWVEMDAVADAASMQPDINPEFTNADGRYRWDVAAGDYRVVVTRAGCTTFTSASVTIPPPVTDLDIGLTCADADADGLRDWRETNNQLFVDETRTGTNPADSDTDNDGALDGAEVVNGTDPLVADMDADGDLDGADNCVFVPNEGQESLDRNFIDNPSPLTQDDASRPNSDAAGDACDDDDDNDGLLDATEATFPSMPGCLSAAAALDALNPDTDGDGYMDGAECAIGTNPNSSASKPSAEQCRVLAGAAAVPTDTDGDLVQDRIEACGYGTSVSSQESDGDGREDQCEIASLNTLPAVNSLDQLLLAQAIIADLGGPFVWNADLNKDGANNSADQLLMAQILIGGGCPAS